jgi:hypothetical protein
VGEDVPSSCLWLRMAGDVPSSMVEVMPTLGMAEIVQLGAGVAGLVRVWPMVVGRLKGSMIQGRTDKSGYFDECVWMVKISFNRCSTI